MQDERLHDSALLVLREAPDAAPDGRNGAGEGDAAAGNSAGEARGCVRERAAVLRDDAGPQQHVGAVADKKDAEGDGKNMRVELLQDFRADRNADDAADQKGRALAPLHAAPEPRDTEQLRGDAAGEEQGDSRRRRQPMQQDGPGHGRKGETGEPRHQGAGEHRAHHHDLRDIDGCERSKLRQCR
jgi:hypothetical protein